MAVSKTGVWSRQERRGGTLDHILEKMSSYYEKVEMAGKVRTAMIYPCILSLHP